MSIMRRFLIFILPLLYYSCTDDIVADIDALQTENAEQDAQIDSLMTALNDQQAYIDSLNNAQNIANDLLQLYADSLHNAQQTTLTALANSALNAGFVETQVYSGNITTSWTDLDLSSVIGANQSLVLMKIDYISDNGRILCRTNGTNYDTGTSGFSSAYNSINWIYVDSGHPTGYLFIITDNAGVIEYKVWEGTANVAISTVFYLNQNDTIGEQTGYISFDIEGTSLTISPSISTIESAANEHGNKTFENSNGFNWDKVDVGDYTFNIVAKIYTIDDNADYVYRDTTLTKTITITKDDHHVLVGSAIYNDYSLHEL